MLSTPFRVAFDLDGTLFSEGYGEFPLTKLSPVEKLLLGASLRKGTLPLLKTLQAQGIELGIYTLSNRASWRLRLFFALHGILLKTIVTHKKHQKALDAGLFPPSLVKYPTAFGFDLLVDNELVIAQQGVKTGFTVALIAPHDRHWEEMVLEQCPLSVPLHSATVAI